jgi:hypothetical protein
LRQDAVLQDGEQCTAQSGRSAVKDFLQVAQTIIIELSCLLTSQRYGTVGRYPRAPIPPSAQNNGEARPVLSTARRYT